MSDRKHVRPLRVGAVALALGCTIAVAVIVSGVASGAGTGAAKHCGSTPAVLDVEGNFSNVAGSQVAPEVPQGVQAALAVINKTCELGVPVKLKACDDQSSVAGATACGQQEVADHPMAVISYSAAGEGYAPILDSAGIPFFPVTANSPTENTSKYSFPLGYSVTSYLGEERLAQSLGAKKLAWIYLDIASVVGNINIATAAAPAMGIQVVKIPIPVTATDMTPYVAQGLAAGADSMIITVGPAGLIGGIKALQQSGKDLTSNSFHFVAGLTSFSQKTVQSVGASTVGGVDLVSNFLSPTDTSNPIVKQYLAELQAAKQPSDPLSVTILGLGAWAGMHMIADRLSAMHLAPTAANVLKTFNSKPSVAPLAVKWGLSAINYLEVPYKHNATLDALRLFSDSAYFYRFNDQGIPVPLAKVPLNVLKSTPLAK